MRVLEKSFASFLSMLSKDRSKEISVLSQKILKLQVSGHATVIRVFFTLLVFPIVSNELPFFKLYSPAYGLDEYYAKLFQNGRRPCRCRWHLTFQKLQASLFSRTLMDLKKGYASSDVYQSTSRRRQERFETPPFPHIVPTLSAK